MAKRITQQTFDAAVAENVEEFGMEPAEALADAVKQFEQQGVDLSNIVKSGSAEAERAAHPVLGPLAALKAAQAAAEEEAEAAAEATGTESSATSAALQTALATLTQACATSADNRAVAVSNQALRIVSEVMRSTDSTDVAAGALEAIAVLSKGNREHVGEPAIEYVLSLISESKSPELLASALRCATALTTKAEDNKKRVMALGFPTICLTILDAHKGDAAIIQELLGLIRSVCNNDDTSATVSTAFPNARELAAKDVHQVLLGLVRSDGGHETVDPLLYHVLPTLRAIAVNNDICKQIADMGIFGLIAKVQELVVLDTQLAVAVLGLLRALAGNDDNKRMMATSVDTITLNVVFKSIAAHPTEARIAELGCGVLAALALREPDNAHVIVAKGGAGLILEVMKTHAATAAVQRAACLAVRNMVGRSPDLCPAFVDIGVDDLIRAARTTHPSAVDSASAALRDLGAPDYAAPTSS